MSELKPHHDDPGWGGGASRDWRLLAAAGLALLVHGALLLVPGLWPREPQPAAPVAANAVEVDLLPTPDSLDDEPLAQVSEAAAAVAPERDRAGAREVTKPADAPDEATARRRRAPEAPPSGPVSPAAPSSPSAPAVVTAPEASATAGVPGEGPPTAGGEPKPGGAGAGDGRKKLSPSQLGLGGGVMRTALADMVDEEPKPGATNDAAQLRQELLDEDTRSGFGAGWELAALVRRAARGRTPVSSTATIAFDVAPSGAVTRIALETATSARGEWTRLLDRLRLMIVGLQKAPGTALTAVLQLRSRSTRRSGEAEGLLDFDVANVGSPWMHQLNVRVLRQVAQ